MTFSLLGHLETKAQSYGLAFNGEGKPSGDTSVPSRRGLHVGKTFGWMGGWVDGWRQWKSESYEKREIMGYSRSEDWPQPFCLSAQDG